MKLFGLARNVNEFIIEKSMVHWMAQSMFREGGNYARNTSGGQLFAFVVYYMYGSTYSYSAKIRYWV